MPVNDLFERLAVEHAQIELVAAALDSFVDSLEDDASPNLHAMIRFVTFLRGYVEGLHHEREEVVLLRTLTKVGFAPKTGVLAHIHDQHRHEARLLLDFEKLASLPTPWGPLSIERIAAAAHALTAFERSHMEKERELLFPVAKKELVAHPDAVATALARFEKSREPRWDAPWLEQLGRELVVKYGRHRVPATT